MTRAYAAAEHNVLDESVQTTDANEGHAPKFNADATIIKTCPQHIWI